MNFDEVYKAIKRNQLERIRDALEKELDADLANKYKVTLLMVAARTGNISIGRLLVEHHADPNRRNKGNGTALSAAAEAGHAQFIKLLLKSGASRECYPFGSSLENFLDWVEEYCLRPQARIKAVRAAFHVI